MQVSHAIEDSIQQEENIVLEKKEKKRRIQNVEETIGFDISRTMLKAYTQGNYRDIRQQILKN